MNKTSNQILPAGRRQNWYPQTIQPAIVSQAELRQIFDFQRQQEEINELIELIHRKMELGASIESGPMRVETVAQSMEAIDKTTLTFDLFFWKRQSQFVSSSDQQPSNDTKGRWRN